MQLELVTFVFAADAAVSVACEPAGAEAMVQAYVSGSFCASSVLLASRVIVMQASGDSGVSVIFGMGA